MIKKLASLIEQNGGRAYYVGGFVRDKLLGISSSDVDVEVHGIAPDKLFSILKSLGEPLCYGESFGIFSLKGENIDIALPRKEKVTGFGHRDFEVSVAPFIGIKEAARRRDFTVNAILEDILTGEILDPFGGVLDLKKGLLRYVDENSFKEDPLRVLRGAQFAARFEFKIEEATLKLFKEIDLKNLSKERVEAELKKALLKSKKPSIFFEVLKEANQLTPWFLEIKQLCNLLQNPIFHPEGDVFVHTMEVIDRAAMYLEKVTEPLSFMLLALTHDFGKICTTKIEKDGKIHSYRHETEGLFLVENFLDRIYSEKKVKDYVLNMVPLHMRPNVAAFSKPTVKSTNHLFDEAYAPKDLIYFAMSDRPVKSQNVPFTGDSDFLFERLKIYKETMEKPFVQGKDLIKAGLVPGEYFSDLLEFSHKLRLAGIDKENALKQTLARAGKNIVNDKNKL